MSFAVTATFMKVNTAASAQSLALQSSSIERQSKAKLMSKGEEARPAQQVGTGLRDLLCQASQQQQASKALGHCNQTQILNVVNFESV